MCDLWLKKVKFDPAKYSTLELIAKAKALNIQTNPKDTWEVVFNRILPFNGNTMHFKLYR